MKKRLPSISPFFAFCAFAVSLLLSCVTTAPIPDWAQSASAITRVYPNGTYIAQRGRGQTREAAETAAAAEIARYFTSQISAGSSYRTTINEQNGAARESRETEDLAFVTSEVNLFGLRYAQDAFYNKAEKQWETVAYLDRAEAWALYEPRFQKQADAFRCRSAERGRLPAAKNRRSPPERECVHRLPG